MIGNLHPGQACRACALILLLCTSTVHADPCDDLIKMDGLFTKARTECGFTYYAWRFQQDSQQCMAKKGKTVSKELFSQGQSVFANNAASLGIDAFCQKLMSDFPMTVKRQTVISSMRGELQTFDFDALTKQVNTDIPI